MANPTGRNRPQGLSAGRAGAEETNAPFPPPTHMKHQSTTPASSTDSFPQHQTNTTNMHDQDYTPHPGKGTDPRRTIDEARYWMPYECGEEDGQAAFDDQYYWGGRVTRRADAVAAARSVIQRVDDCEPLLDELPMPQGARIEGMLEELRDAYGAEAFASYLQAEDLTEEDLLEDMTLRWQEGYSAGHDDAARSSAEEFLGE